MTPATVRAFIAGASGSGKSTLAWRMYLSRFPRRLLLDQTGEWSDPSRYPPGYPGPQAIVSDVPELSQALASWATRGRWTIVAELGLDDFPALVDYLIPVPRLQDSPIYQVGGAVLLVDEADLVAPPRGLREEVRTLYRRSRHVGLSIVSTTQRPEAVSREVSAQSTQVVALGLVEPAALAYMGDVMGRELSGLLPAWTRAHPHGGLWWNRLSGALAWLDDSGALRPAQAPPPWSGDGDDAAAPVGPAPEPPGPRAP